MRKPERGGGPGVLRSQHERSAICPVLVDAATDRRCPEMDRSLATCRTRTGANPSSRVAPARRLSGHRPALWPGRLHANTSGSEAVVGISGTTGLVPARRATHEKQLAMNEVLKAAAELQLFCDSHRWRFCFIGGLALQRWGEPRETVDVDLTLFAGFGREQHFSDTLLKHFEPRISNA